MPSVGGSLLIWKLTCQLDHVNETLFSWPVDPLGGRLASEPSSGACWHHWFFFFGGGGGATCRFDRLCRHVKVTRRRSVMSPGLWPTTSVGGHRLSLTVCWPWPFFSPGAKFNFNFVGRTNFFLCLMITVTRWRWCRFNFDSFLWKCWTFRFMAAVGVLIFGGAVTKIWQSADANRWVLGEDCNFGFRSFVIGPSFGWRFTRNERTSSCALNLSWRRVRHTNNGRRNGLHDLWNWK